MIETINEQTPIALGAVILLGSGMVAATGWIIKSISQIRDDVRDVKSTVDLLRQEMESRTNGSLKREDFMRYMLRVKSLNDNFHLPEETP